MKLIVGLGNPGSEYAKTRHNCGWQVLDALADHLELSFQEQSKWRAEMAKATIAHERVILMKPLTFMNLSGEAIACLANFYKIAPADIWVVYDDIDLPLGRLRVRETGSSGGHNGVKSVIQELGTENFYHLRLGVGPQLKPDGTADQLPPLDTAVYVLQPFESTEQPIVDKAVAIMASIIRDGLTHDILESRSYAVDEPS